MTWNHRVLRHRNTKTGEFYFAVHEVYYDEDGEPDAWTQEPIALVNDTMEDMREEINMIARALATPILEIDGDKLHEIR